MADKPNDTLDIVDQILRDNAAKLNEYEQSYNAIQPQAESEKVSESPPEALDLQAADPQLKQS